MEAIRRSIDAVLKDSSTQVPTVKEGLLTLDGIDTSALHETIQDRSGELIFYTVPHASLQVGILGEAEGLKEMPETTQASTGWKNAEVPVVGGLTYGFLVVDSGRHAERGDGRQLSESMAIHMPPKLSSVAHYTHDRGVQIVLDTDLRRIRGQVEKWDWILAVGNSAVAYAGLALAEAELKDRPDYIGLQESHGLLLLSAIRKLGIDWHQQEGRNRQLDRLVARLEQDMVDLGILPIVLHRLGWDRDQNGSHDYWQLEEERIARRLKAFDLKFDPVKVRISSLLAGKELSAGKNQQEYSASLAGGEYNKFVDVAVDNLLTNYLGISKD